MRFAFAIVLTCLLVLSLVVRATPRACGSAFACCDVPRAVSHVAPCCEKEAPSKVPGSRHGDEAMACCMPLTMPTTVAASDLATHALAGNGVERIERSVITHTLEPATPPPRTFA